MMNRTGTCAAVILFGIVGPCGLFSIPASADDTSTANTSSAGASTSNPGTASASTADECLAAPKAATPQGSHWYFHVEKGTGRKCWYLGPQGTKLKSATVAPSGAKSSDAADSTANEPQQQSLQSSVANARAELRTTTPAPPVTSSMPPAALSNPGLLSGQMSAPGAASNIAGSTQTLASRWPDPNAFKPASETQQVAQNTAPAPADNQTQAEQQAAPPPVAPRPLPADMHSNTAQSVNAALTPARVMLAALFIVLAIAAIFARNAFRYFSRSDVKITRRRDIWGQADYGEQSMPSYEEMVTPERRNRDAGKPREEIDEIEYLLRRAARREAQQRYFSS